MLERIDSKVGGNILWNANAARCLSYIQIMSENPAARLLEVLDNLYDAAAEHVPRNHPVPENADLSGPTITEKTAWGCVSARMMCPVIKLQMCTSRYFEPARCTGSLFGNGEAAC